MRVGRCASVCVCVCVCLCVCVCMGVHAGGWYCVCKCACVCVWMGVRVRVWGGGFAWVCVPAVATQVQGSTVEHLAVDVNIG